MKKILQFFVGLGAGLALMLGALVYRWMQTPNGRLHPVMAILHQSFQRASMGPLTEERLPQLRRLMGSVPPLVAVARVTDSVIDGPHGKIPIRIYAPSGKGPFPVTLFFHGGGFALGSIATHENVARRLVRDVGSVVVSVDYRLAPEHPFPVALDEAYAALEWLARNAATFDGEASRLLVAGDSAGGNLAAAVALRARDENGPAVSLQVLLYPVLDMSGELTDSRTRFLGYVLTAEMMEKFLPWYLPQEADRIHPYASPLYASNYEKLPPAVIVTAAFDPLIDDGVRYATALRAAGVPVTYRSYDGMMHGFLSFADLVERFPMADKILAAPADVYRVIRAAVPAAGNQ